ncbi:MAG: SDR family oxidoreductase [Myxococcales bacterium]|nr:MAG: SDR family oxidoreductase [Myxococcales bacterium]
MTRDFNPKQNLSGKTLLVTGVSGFVAKVWLAFTLDRISDLKQVYILLRSTRKQSAAERFLDMIGRNPVFRPLREKYGNSYEAFIKSKVTVLEGDIQQAKCALSDKTCKELLPRIDAVVHIAGITDFQADPKLALSVNVRGALHVADLAAQTPSKKLIHISTAYVAGVAQGQVQESIEYGICPKGEVFDPRETLRDIEAACMRSDALFLPQEDRKAKQARIDIAVRFAEELGWRNIYTLSKGLAEHLLVHRKDIDLCIARPSVVECATDFPFAGWNEGINTSAPLVWLLSTPYRWIPSQSSNRFDVVRGDEVARGISLVLAASLSNQAKAVYHLCSSSINPVSFGRTLDLVALGIRRHQRMHQSESLKKRLWSHLDAFEVEGDTHLRRLGVWRKRSEQAEGLLRTFHERHVRSKFAGTSVDKAVKRLVKSIKHGKRTLNRIEYMLTLYRPFTHDHDYIFQSENLQTLNEELDPTVESAFRFGIDNLDWYGYWINVQIPGLMKWCIPLIEGQKVPDDLSLRLVEKRLGVVQPSTESAEVSRAEI